MLITRRSIITGIERTIEIPCTPEQLRAWERGEGLIQNLMPGLSVDQREFIMTGIISKEWDETVPEEDDEE
jgi:hypothetical protein